MQRGFRNVVLGDPVLFTAVLALSAFGILMIYSAGLVDVPHEVARGAWRNQLLWWILSLVFLPFVLRLRVLWLEWAARPIYAIAVVLLLLTLVIGTGAGTAASTKSWIALGPLRFQPAEFAKIAVALMLAHELSGWREPPKTLWQLWRPIVITLVPMGLVMLQPDLGSAMVFAGILVAGLFWAGTPLPTLFFLVTPVISLFLSINTWLWGAWIVLLVVLLVLSRPYLSEAISILLLNIAAGAAALPLWQSLEPYQKNRLLVFLNPAVDPRGAGYNLIQSRVAIGSGGAFGKGLFEGTQKRLAFLPEQHTDFIFAVVGEELGFFFGVLPVLLTYGLIFWRLVRIAERAEDPFASLVPFCLFGSWFTHVLVNTGMTVGIMPITGIPLPFLSYGGSFLLMNMMAMGIVQRIAAESRG